MDKINQKPTLRLKTFELLRNRPASMKLKDIAEATDLSLPWIKMFNRKGNQQASSGDRLQTLYEYLAGKPLL